MYMIFVWWAAFIFILCLLAIGLSVVVPLGQRRIYAVVRVCNILLVIILSSLAISGYGVWGGAALSIVGAVLALFVSQRTYVRHLSARLYDKHFLQLHKALAGQSWIDHMGQRGPVGAHIGLASYDELISTIEGARFLSQPERTLLASVIASRDMRAREIMRSLDDSVSISSKEIIGPLLLDELHHSNQDIFPITNPEGNIIGAVHLSSLLDMSSLSSKVSDVAQSSIVKVGPDQHVRTIIETMFSEHVMLCVVHDTHDIGIISMADALHALLGKHTA
jgi:predicted transcriptional regulator